MTTPTTNSKMPRRHERWANLRHAIIGTLLAAPPARGELRACAGYSSVCVRKKRSISETKSSVDALWS